MLAIRKINPVARAVTVVGAVVALATGVTFAALNSTATLTDNEITTATASLVIDNTDVEGANTDNSDTGFSFTGLVPGGGYSAPQHFSLSNTGNVDLDVTVYATVGTVTGTGLDKSKVVVKFTNNNPEESAEYTLAQLEALFNNVPGSGGPTATLPDGETENFDVQVQLLPGAVSGSGPVEINDFDLVFTGTNEAEVVVPVVED